MKRKYLTISLMLTLGLGQSVMAADSAKPASEATKVANAAVLKELPFNNKQAFEDSEKGFIAPLFRHCIHFHSDLDCPAWRICTRECGFHDAIESPPCLDRAADGKHRFIADSAAGR